MNTLKWKCHLWREIDTFPAVLFPLPRVLSIFRQKMDGFNLLEMDIEVFIPAPTYCLGVQIFPQLGNKNIYQVSTSEYEKNN